MNVIWRFFIVLFFSRFYSKTDLFDESTINFRVLPTDIDVLFHMNNGRYFSLMDLGRLNFMVRNNTFYPLKKHKVYAVVASEMIRFKKSLNVFQKFGITTKILGWDEKFVYVVQYFKRKHEVCAISLVKCRFMQMEKGPLSPIEVLQLVGVNSESLPLPEWVKHWQHADKEFHDQTIEKEKTI